MPAGLWGGPEHHAVAVLHVPAHEVHDVAQDVRAVHQVEEGLVLDEAVADAEGLVGRHAPLLAEACAELLKSVVEDRHLVGVQEVLDDEEPALVQ